MKNLVGILSMIVIFVALATSSANAQTRTENTTTTSRYFVVKTDVKDSEIISVKTDSRSWAVDYSLSGIQKIVNLGSQGNQRMGDLLVFYFTRSRETAEVLIGFAYSSEVLNVKDGHVYTVWVCELTQWETFGIVNVQTLVSKLSSGEIIYNPESDKRIMPAPVAPTKSGGFPSWILWILGVAAVAGLGYWIYKQVTKAPAPAPGTATA